MTRAPDTFLVYRADPRLSGAVLYLSGEPGAAFGTTRTRDEAAAYSLESATAAARALNLCATPVRGAAPWRIGVSVIGVPAGYARQAGEAPAGAEPVDLSEYCEGLAGGSRLSRPAVDTWPFRRLMDLHAAMQWLLDCLHDAGETHGDDGTIHDCVEHAAAALVEAGGHLNWYSAADARAYRLREAAEAQAEVDALAGRVGVAEPTGGPHAWDDGEIARGMAAAISSWRPLAPKGGVSDLAAIMRKNLDHSIMVSVAEIRAARRKSTAE